MEQKVKQIIIIRKDLRMGCGKKISQGCHATVGVILDHVSNNKVTKAMEEWLESGMTKIAVSVNSEEELLSVYQEALSAGIPTKIIRDSGLTQFHGVPTLTAVAIGPDYSHKIDKITGELKLL